MSVSYNGPLCGTGSFSTNGRGHVDGNGSANFTYLTASGDSSNQDFIDDPDFRRNLNYNVTAAIAAQN